MNPAAEVHHPRGRAGGRTRHLHQSTGTAGVQTRCEVKPPSRGWTRMGVPGVTPKGIGDPTLLPPHDADTPGAYEGGGSKQQ